MNFIEAVKSRRSIYSLSNESVISDDLLEKIIAENILYTPSAFNSQSQTAVLLLNQRHQELWSIVLEALRKIVPPASFSKTEAKIKSFAAAHGTILFFDNQNITQGLMKDFPLYKDNFAVWYQQHAGMLQSNVWVSLSEIGYGASLQHYNELIEADVKKAFNIPDGWQLIAQMPFGKPTQTPQAKEFTPLEKRFVVLK